MESYRQCGLCAAHRIGMRILCYPSLGHHNCVALNLLRCNKSLIICYLFADDGGNGMPGTCATRPAIQWTSQHESTRLSGVGGDGVRTLLPLKPGSGMLQQQTAGIRTHHGGDFVKTCGTPNVEKQLAKTKHLTCTTRMARECAGWAWMRDTPKIVPNNQVFGHASAKQ
jgi:hypothetical protein